jgi:hypothetical protein
MDVAVGDFVRDFVGDPTAVEELVAVPEALVGEEASPIRSGTVLHAENSTSSAPREHWRNSSRRGCLDIVEPP